MPSSTRIMIRLFAPLTEYVVPSFYHRDAVYSADPEIVYTATRQSDDSIGDVYTEVATLVPEEVRLCAAIGLSVAEGRGMVGFVPTQVYDRIDLTVRTDLRDPAVRARCNDHALELLASQKVFSGPYRLRSATRSDPDIELALFKAIDLKDGVLIRGLYTLLKSQALMRSDLFLFMEEAFINLQISREAALLMIRQHLTYLGRTNASYKDAHDYIRTNFVLGEFLAGFFEEQYDPLGGNEAPIKLVRGRLRSVNHCGRLLRRVRMPRFALSAHPAK
jgi:hypothetical protein